MLHPLGTDGTNRSPQRGGRWVDHWEVIEAIAWKYHTGSPWRDLPTGFGSWKGAYSRFRRCTLDGTWQRLLSAVQAASDCRPMSLVVTAGRAHDAPQFTAVMDAIAVPRQRPGRPRQRPARVLADKAYSSRAIRDWLRRRATIPQPADQRAHRRRRGSGGDRPPAFDKIAYRQRNVAERCINRLKQWRGVAMRPDKLAVHYQAALTLAGILLWTQP